MSVIQEFDMLALLAALDSWNPMFLNRRVVVFTDSEAVRGSFPKTWSNNTLCSDLLLKIFQVEESSMCQIWLERVPSQSNPADLMSREKVMRWMNVERQPVDYHSLWEQVAIGRG